MMNQITTQRPKINLTNTLKYQNAYTLALNGEYSDKAFDEVRGPLNKGKWHDLFFQPLDVPIDVEIGTGRGDHFAHYAQQHPHRMLVGVELKYKPLIQSIRRALSQGSLNTRIVRFHAFNLDQIFEKEEISNIIIHFPDPWVSPRKPKNRLVSVENLNQLYSLQRPGSFLDFKTDSREYFLWALNEIHQTSYQIEFLTFDLHRSEYAKENFVTQFEQIFLKKNIDINYVRLKKLNL